ncbi:unnamed protein product [Cladocopium goreaui]|uniref:Uncharacterized protein n=1 Tax=Cladocopium goreaui TaxID=2562237 RepID=A0A9P1D6Z0_9DINO|nr:unnamed protein product [Cladocopium goreaui]
MKIVTLFALSAAVKFRVHPTADDEWCTGNQFPLDVDASYHAAGLAKGEDLFNKEDLSQFQVKLGQVQEWAAASPWHLRVTVNSSLSSEVKFGFPGTGGFLMISVPPNAKGELVVTDRVGAAQEPTFQYREGPARLDGDVVFTKFCLRPKLCGEEDFCQDGWKAKSGDALPGNSRMECCDQIQCAESDKVDGCSGTTWTKKPNFTELQGHTKEQCCQPLLCTADVCKGSDVKVKNGTGILGSTAEECCEPAYCRDVECPSMTEYTRLIHNDDGTARRGSTAKDCCKEAKCADLDCGASPRSAWKNSSRQGLGSTYPECCDKSYCADFTCQPSTKWVSRNLSSLRGGNTEACCQPLTCKRYTCKDPSLVLKQAAGLLGSTDEECCELKSCKDYTCSDATKWTKRPVLVDGVLRKGVDDATCCEDIFCMHSIDCEGVDGSKWRTKKPLELQNLQGSTAKQCCDANLCEAYTCSTDVDGDGDGTKWYKKVDTNAHKYQGQSDEECCFPKYCSLYTTKLPSSKWKRNSTVGLLGSTDGECYVERRCVDEVNCHALGIAVNVTDEDRLGSTKDECCW